MRQIKAKGMDISMKILHISRTMGQGGAEKVVYQLCCDNRDAVQYVISNGGVYVDILERVGIKHYWMPDIDKKDPFLMLECFFGILKVVKKEHIDIIHSHHRMGAFYARLVSFFTNAKCVYTAHNIFENKRKLLRFSLKKCTIIAVGNSVKKNLVEYYGIPEKEIFVICNCVKIKKNGTRNIRLDKEISNGKFLIGTIGRLTEQKGIDVFIKAINLIKEDYPQVIGVIIGEGEKKEELQELVYKLKVSENIIFLGYQENIIDILEQLKYVVLVSRWEGFPLTPIEAFSQGKAVIATDIPGNNEIVKDGVNGLLVKKEDFRALANAMKRLIENPQLLYNLEKTAKDNYSQNYEYSKFVTNYQRVYNKVVGK